MNADALLSQARDTLGRIAEYSDYAGVQRAFTAVKDMARSCCRMIDVELAVALPAERASDRDAVIELATKCRPAVKQWANGCAMQSLQVDRGKYPPHYKPLMAVEAERAAQLLDEIDAIIDSRTLKGAGEEGL